MPSIVVRHRQAAFQTNTMTTSAASVFDQLLCPDTIADRLKSSTALQALPTRSNKSDTHPRHVSIDLREADGKIDLEMDAALARKKPSTPKPRVAAANH
ncbi:hypothetical protein [Piscinibacter sakaiensis]|uniref:hypothetical protein n=1 Tax=Piscinibacter sakaiensis TaxID=1547922 RepID=UPI003AAE6813